MKRVKKSSANNGYMKKTQRKEEMWCYIMLALPIIGFVVFHVYPILWTFKWSFYSYDGIESNAVFIGLKNFKTVFKDSTYWESWLTTLEFSVFKVPLEMLLAMGLAIILLKGLKGSGIFRIIFYMPNVISVAVIGVIFTNLFTYFGVFNTFLVDVGLIDKPIDWFASKGYAMLMLVIGSIWNTLGINVMYCMSALANVPEELYECASLDGANAWVKFTKITLPMVMPVFSVVLLLSIIGTLSTNDYILAFTGGAPNGATNTVMSYLTQGFVPGFTDTSTPPLGYGNAVSLVTTIIFAVVGVLHNKISNK